MNPNIYPCDPITLEFTENWAELMQRQDLTELTQPIHRLSQAFLTLEAEQMDLYCYNLHLFAQEIPKVIKAYKAKTLSAKMARSQEEIEKTKEKLLQFEKEISEYEASINEESKLIETLEAEIQNFAKVAQKQNQTMDQLLQFKLNTQ